MIIQKCKIIPFLKKRGCYVFVAKIPRKCEVIASFLGHNLLTMSKDQFKIEEVFRPLNLAEKKYAPEILFLKGDTSLLNSGVRVSLIGSREASSGGLRRARKLSSILTDKNITVVSGLALGIDSEAHRSAIESGGRTIAVLGTPLSSYYPKENKSLQDDISLHHLLVSQFAEESKVHKGNFPTRNRLMALISDATVIIEARDGSGTEHQGWEAIRLARPLWILQSSYDDTTIRWPREFVKYGAQVLADDSLEQFFDMLPSRDYGIQHEFITF